jgi:hypothetical protein
MLACATIAPLSRLAAWSRGYSIEPFHPDLYDLADGSRATAKDSRSKKAAAPAPNKTHCQVAKVDPALSMARQMPSGEHGF